VYWPFLAEEARDINIDKIKVGNESTNVRE
jgi:hypothetical protein